MVVGSTIGCGPKYEVEHRLKGRGRSLVLEVKIKGRATDLAVMLIAPNEEVIKIREISKRDLIDNIEEITLYFKRTPKPQETYFLVIKTIEPEKVVYKQKIEFETAEISIDRIHIGCQKDNPYRTLYKRDEPYVVGPISFRLKKQGNLPVVFSSALVTIGDKEIRVGSLLIEPAVITEEEKVVEIHRGLTFPEGEYPVKVKLRCNIRRDSLVIINNQVRVPGGLGVSPKALEADEKFLERIEEKRRKGYEVGETLQKVEEEIKRGLERAKRKK